MIQQIESKVFQWCVSFLSHEDYIKKWTLGGSANGHSLFNYVHLMTIIKHLSSLNNSMHIFKLIVKVISSWSKSIRGYLSGYHKFMAHQKSLLYRGSKMLRCSLEASHIYVCYPQVGHSSMYWIIHMWRKDIMGLFI